MRYFFDIPVYRLGNQQYNAEQDSYIEKELYGVDPEEIAIRKAYYSVQRNHFVVSHSHLQNLYGGPWQFNEIVGYIRLYFLGSQVRGELWMVSARRIVRTRRKQFSCREHTIVSGSEVPLSVSNEDLFQIICEYLERATRELKDRFVDTTIFYAIGKYVDWNSLREQLHPRSH